MPPTMPRQRRPAHSSTVGVGASRAMAVVSAWEGEAPGEPLLPPLRLGGSLALP